MESQTKTEQIIQKNRINKQKHSHKPKKNGSRDEERKQNNIRQIRELGIKRNGEKEREREGE